MAASDKSLLSSLWLCVPGMESPISHSMHPIFPGHYDGSGRTPIPQRAVIITICSLSVIGSLLIVLSFCCGKELRTKLRSYVLFISIMDIMYSSANLVGAGIDFGQYVNRTRSGDWQFSPSPTLNAVCIAQGVFAAYGTLASILWTVCMGVYVYFGVLCYLNERYERMLQGIYWSSHIISWVLPLYVTVWALALGQITYSPWGSFGGWCTAMGNQDSPGSNIRLVVFMRSDYSTLSASLLILVFCSATLTILCNTKTPSLKGQVNLKLISIPLVFIFLRMWSTFVASIYWYPRSSDTDEPIPVALQYLSAIGDSSQGLFNFVIYCLLTKRVRDIMWRKPQSLLVSMRSWSSVHG